MTEEKAIRANYRKKRKKYLNKHAKGHQIVYNGIVHKAKTRKGGALMRN